MTADQTIEVFTQKLMKRLWEIDTIRKELRDEETHIFEQLDKVGVRKLEDEIVQMKGKMTYRVTAKLKGKD